MSGKWYTPSEVETLGGKKAWKWRQSLSHQDKPLLAYDLSAPGSTPFSVSGPPVDTTTPSTQHSDSCSQPLSTSADPKTPVGGVAGPYLGESYPNMLSDPVLAFIKAFQLKGDFDSIKRSVCEHFDRELVEGAKIALWKFCAKV